MRTRPFPDRLMHLVAAEWRWKLLLTVLISGGFWAAYSALGHHAYHPPRTVPLTWLDRVTPYQPLPWAWIYLSQFSFTSVLPWLLPTSAALRRYAAGFTLLSLSSFVVFLWYPVAAPRMGNPGADHAMRLIRTYDGPLNCFPSLHAGFLVFHAALAWRMFGTIAPKWCVPVGLAWGAGILYATLATKQHYVVDLAAGAVLGAAADWLVWRTSGSSARIDPTRWRRKGVRSQAGDR